MSVPNRLRAIKRLAFHEGRVLDARMQKLFAGKTVDGWGVIRDEPWHFAGVFPSEAKARRKAAQLGPGYDVRYGQGGKGTLGFMVAPTAPPPPAADDSR